MDYKLSEEHRAEVNTLIERAQDDLEGVLYRLIGQREKLRELGNDLRDSCSHFGWTSAEHEWPRATKRIKAWNECRANG